MAQNNSNDDSTARPLRRDEALLAAVLSGVVAFLVYTPSLGFDFTNWDDHVYVYENPNIRSLGKEMVSWAFTSIVHANYHPLTMISLAIDYAMWGQGPKGFHFTNVLMNAINAWLVTMLTAMLFTSRGLKSALSGRAVLVASITTGLLFATHPLHVESVAWISERKDVLSLFFFLLGVILYVKHATAGDAGAWKYYFISIVLVALSLLSKPMAVSAPLVLLILDYFPLGRLSRSRAMVLEKAPYFALSILSALVTLWAQGKGGAIRTLETHSLDERLYTALGAYFFYIYKTFLPIGLAPLYPYPDAGTSAGLKIALLFAVLALLTFIAVYVLRARRFPASAWLYYVVTLLPVIGIIQVGNQGAADRYTYMPGIAIFMLVGGLVGYAWASSKGRGRFMCVVLLACVVAVLALLTIRQEAVWKDSVSLWTRQTSLYPEKSHTAYNLRGNALLKLGRAAEALSDYNAAIALDPTLADPYYNRAFLYQNDREFKKAIEDYSRVIAINDGYFKAYMNRGISYAELGMPVEAIDDFTKAIVIDPDVPEAFRFRGLTRLDAGDLAGAVSDYARLAQNGRASGDDLYNLARAYDGLGDRKAAMEYLEAGARLGHAPSIEMLSELNKK
jgi:Tfp pilus assembly protein PilF